MKFAGRSILLLLVFGGIAFLLLREKPVKVAAYLPRKTVEAEVWDWRAHSHTPPAEGAACAACHAEIVAQWTHSQHANANRLVENSPLRPGYSHYGGVETVIDEDLRLEQQGLEGFTFSGSPVAVIAVEPLIQPLVLTTNGRWQVFNPAFQVETNGWFNAFPEVRNFKEWGHWSGRGMNWNVQCAWCHTTDFKKNYDIDSDSYASTWKAMGISCSQCHGDLSDHAANPQQVPGKKFDPLIAQENCMTCHARRGFLTPEKFVAGEKFHDHFRLNLMDRPGVYYPDGQVLDENFETGSFISSKMHDAGVTCLDCHNPHSGGLKLPVENNLLCMSCHAPPGQNGGTPILPTAHSHHALESAGNRCVECHMPETMYMQADLRRDHGFTVPDPMLTRTLGIPNACNRCHEDQSVAWAEKWAEEWYGDKLAARRTRPRAQAIQEAWNGKENLGPSLLALARTETNVNWRASLIRLMRGYIPDNDVREFVQASLSHEHELVRAAAVYALGDFEVFHPQITRLREDPSRLVRLDAAWVTRGGAPLPEALAAELDAWLAFNADQPAGALDMAQLALTNRDADAVEKWVRRLILYDGSGEPHRIGGQLLHAVDKSAQAQALFERAVEIEPGVQDGWFMLGMIRNENGDLEGATDAFRRLVLLNPNHARGWYNLGLAHVQNGNRDAGLIALSRAEVADPDSADAAYAAATVYLQDGKVEEAKMAITRALQADPAHAPSRQLFFRMNGGR